jgi:hypothetical protein
MADRHRERDVSELDWTIPNRLRADALHRSVASWDTLTSAADEIERLQKVNRRRATDLSRPLLAPDASRLCGGECRKDGRLIVSEKDLVLRLRHMAKLLGFDLPALLNEAADEIERLRREAKKADLSS